jgi:hypothetical protein
MDANSFLKRIALFSLLTALPIFGSASPPGGGGHSSGGGHSAGGGHAVGGGGGHAVGGRDQVVGGRRDAVIGGRSSVGTRANASTVRGGTVPVANSRSFRNDPS